MTGVILTLGALQIAVPLILLYWQWRERSPGKFQWLLKTILIIGYLTVVAAAGLWSWIPFFVPYLFLIAGPVFAARGWYRVRALPFWTAKNNLELIKLGLTALLAALAAGLAVYAAAGHRMPPGNAVELAFPLKNGTFYIVNGGSNSLINAHLNTLEAERFRHFRGQSYAVDVLQLNPFGLRANGFLPSDPSEYAIFGTPVFAPCAGTVLETENGREDMPVPQTDREVMPGNHVLLDCGEFIILLAHFKKGSVAVAAGQKVETGAALGEVGNSGNSEEPHLHIHAQRSGSEPNALDGAPLWMIFEGEFLTRNRILMR